MKKIISILSVSLFAVVFAAGCGESKLENCAKADKVGQCTTASNFKDSTACVAKFKDATKTADTDAADCKSATDAEAAVKADCTAVNSADDMDAAGTGDKADKCTTILKNYKGLDSKIKCEIDATNKKKCAFTPKAS